MTSPYGIDALENALAQELGRKAEAAADHRRRAALGERVRRARFAARQDAGVKDADVEHEGAGALLPEAYTHWIAELSREVLRPADLEEELERALDALEARANTAYRDRDRGAGSDLIERVDTALAVPAVAARAGAISRAELARLAERARSRAHALAPDLRDLWRTAEERGLELGPDPDYPELYGWLDELAAFGDGHLALGIATLVETGSARQGVPSARTERFVARLRSSGALELPRHQKTIVFRRELARSALALAAADAASDDDLEDPAADGEVVHDAAGVEIRAKEVPEPGDAGASLICLRVMLAPGRVAGDLTREGAVKVTDASGAELNPLRRLERPRLWSGRFAGQPPLVLALPELDLAVELSVERG